MLFRRSSAILRLSEGCARWPQIMLEGVGTRRSDTEQVPSDGGSKRRKLDRAGGAVLPWHAVPLQPDERTARRQPRCDDHGRHHLVTRNVMASTDREWLLQLQQHMQPDQLDEATAAVVGAQRKFWTAWPHACGSNLSSTSAQHARELVNEVLNKISGVCPACDQDANTHKVHEIELMEYRGAGASCAVHKDDVMPGVDRLERQQGTLLVMLNIGCQGGILHVARRQNGRIVQRVGHGGGPRDIARDAVGLVLLPGDAVILANVDHCVSRIASGSRALLAARLSCPAAGRTRNRAT